jgi:type II secretory pathway pseudopilin PulG
VSKLFIFEKSFTLLEILLVIGIISILLAFIVPVSLDFYRSQQLEIQTQSIIQTLRRAQSKATVVELDSSFGVYFGASNYTLFKGSSYSDSGRDSQYDEIFDLPGLINLTGLSEVVFSKFEGKPNVTGNIILSSDSDTKTININQVGRINLQ